MLPARGDPRVPVLENRAQDWCAGGIEVERLLHGRHHGFGDSLSVVLKVLTRRSRSIGDGPRADQTPGACTSALAATPSELTTYSRAT